MNVFTHEQLGSILSTLPDPAFILTRSGRYAALFGGTDTRYYHDGSGLVGLNMYDVLHREKADWFSEQIELALATRALHIVEYSLSGSDVKGLEAAGPDHPIWFEGRIKALEFLVEGEEAVVWVASNITEKNAIETRLRVESETDALTGVHNRRKFMEELAGRFRTFGSDGTPTAALMFDIDHFKQINDVLGHGMGDCVLREVAESCRASLGATGIFGRLGGDEFVVLLPGMTSAEALPRANLLRLLIAGNIRDRFGVEATVSGGLSAFLATDLSEEDVLHRADAGLYLSKRNGRNRISEAEAAPDGASMASAC